MNTHNQFTSSKERIHLLLVLFLSIIFCSCTKEDSPVSIEATSKVVTTRTSQDEYFEHAKLPQIIKIYSLFSANAASSAMQAAAPCG